MIIGDPYKFAVLFDRIADWNDSLTDNNGLFALCIDGKLFPDKVINVVIPASIVDIKESLINIPVNEMIYDMDIENSFKALYEFVYPDIDNYENNVYDYRYELATTDLTDVDNLVFAVKGKGMIKILAAKLEYDFKESHYIFDKSTITEIILEKNYVNNVIAQLEEIKWN